MASIPLVLDATATDLPAGTPVYAYIVGLVQGSTGNTFYRLDAQGIPHALSTADNTQLAGTFPGMDGLGAAAVAALAPNYPQAWANYAIELSRTSPTTLDLANLNPTTMPGLGVGTAAFSGRVYVSVGVPILPFTAMATGYVAPVVTGAPGSLCLFDWIEFSFDSAQNFNGNTTQVDQFGFALTLDGTPGGSLQGALNTSRGKVLAAVDALPAPFAPGVLTVSVPDAATAAYPPVARLRAISPKTLTAQPAYQGPVSGYFDADLSQWYAQWARTPLVVHDLATGDYTGVVDTNGVLNFYPGRYTTLAAWQAAAPPLAFALTGSNPASGQVTSVDVWQCANSLASGDASQLNVGKNLAAAFNRGYVSDLLDDATCSADAATFYPVGGTFNAWSQLFHAVSGNGLAYGFPYDDLCGQNPSISLAGTTGVTITLGKFFG